MAHAELEEELAEEIDAAEHFLLVDKYGWVWCAHCEWFYIVAGWGTLFAPEEAAESYNRHLFFRNVEDETPEDDPWEWWDIYSEFGMVDDIWAGDRNYEDDPPFLNWPTEHPTEWQCSMVVMNGYHDEDGVWRWHFEVDQNTKLCYHEDYRMPADDAFCDTLYADEVYK